MKFTTILFIFFFFLYPPCVSAEYYRYTDDKGVVHFTDNLTDVPMAQRKEANKYEGVTESANFEEDQEKDPALSGKMVNKQINESKKSDALTENQTLLQIQILNKKKETLDKEKKILDKAFEQLVTKKQALIKQKESVSTASEVKAYNLKIEKMNQEISDFEKRRQKFAEKARAFNEQAAQ